MDSAQRLAMLGAGMRAARVNGGVVGGREPRVSVRERGVRRRRSPALTTAPIVLVPTAKLGACVGGDSEVGPACEQAKNNVRSDFFHA